MRTIEKSTRNTRNYRKQRKIKALEYKGGKCSVCSYDKCVEALHFHHMDETQKEFQITSNTNKSWERTLKELDKCILVCANCHAEIHSKEKSNRSHLA